MNQVPSLNNEEVYKINKKFISLLVLTSIFAVFVGFLFNFSFKAKVTSILDSNLKRNRKCPANYKALELGSIIPSLTLKDLEISGRCFGSRTPLNLKKLESGLSLPSFSPFGLGVKTVARDKYSKIEVLSVHNYPTHHFKIESKKLSSKTLAPFLGKLKLGGNFEVNAKTSTDLKSMKSLNLQIKSKNFSLPSQELNGFAIPSMKIGPLSLKAQTSGKKRLKISELIVGNELSPIRAKLSGLITLDKYRFTKSKINLTANFKLSATLLESFAILKLFLSPDKQDEQGFYNVKITGTVGKPNKPEFIKL